MNTQQTREEMYVHHRIGTTKYYRSPFDNVGRQLSSHHSHCEWHRKRGSQPTASVNRALQLTAQTVGKPVATEIMELLTMLPPSEELSLHGPASQGKTHFAEDMTEAQWKRKHHESRFALSVYAAARVGALLYDDDDNPMTPQEYITWVVSSCEGDLPWLYRETQDMWTRKRNILIAMNEDIPEPQDVAA